MDAFQYPYLHFYGWWQFVTCLFAFLGLMAIWYHIGRKQNDFGQVWLALSILCWSITGFVEIGYSMSLAPRWNCLLSNTDVIFDEQELLFAELNGWRSVLSLFNSLFVLLALPWFRHLPKYLEPVIKSKYWYLIVGLPFLFSLLPTLSKIMTGAENTLISELDVYYAVMTLVLLGFVLWESFTKRRLKALAYLTVVCILITFIAQVYKLRDFESNQLIFASIFKSSLIMIFFALSLSWVKDLVEKVQINAFNVRMKLFKEKEGRSFSNYVKLAGIGEEKQIKLTNKNFELLSLFIAKKTETEEGWLEIKPKADNRSGRAYDIKDYNELKRLLHSILDGLYGKEVWSKIDHELPVKEAIFEFSKEKDRQIRLNPPKENFSISV